MVEVAATGSNNTDPNLENEHSENAHLPSVRAAMALGASSGEMEQNDFKIPYLSIAYGVGKLSERFNPGDLVIGGEHFIAKKAEKIRVVILSDVKYFKERLSKADFDNGARPRSFLTREEVLKNGGTLEWVEDEHGKVGPTFGPALDMKLLIEKPAALEQSIFGIEIEGKFYAPAFFSVDKSAYNRVGKEIHTNKSLALSKSGILGGVWELWTESQIINKNPTVVPMIKLVSRTTDVFRTEVMRLFSGR